MPIVADILFITGIIVAANGMLSTNALATAEPHKIIAQIAKRLPPLILPMNSAITTSTPVSSSPPTTINKPMKNNNVL